MLREGVDLQFFDIIGKGLFGYLSNLSKLKRKIRVFQPDIIHCHYSLSCILTSITFTGTPIVASLMGSDLYIFGKLKLFILRVLARYSWDKTIVKSKNLYRRLGVETAHVIPNGVNFDDFKVINKQEAQSILGWESKHKHIIFASYPDRIEKNFILAENSIKTLIDQKIKVELHFLNGINFSEMVYYYNAADVLLMTSLYEGSPNVIKEAMACNCPIVSTDVGDVKEILKNILGTFIVDSNTESVAEALGKALAFNSRTEGREMIKELDSKLIALKIIKIYESLTKER
jgi:glycosyltransferase involved in cell wall biosynthesis